MCFQAEISTVRSFCDPRVRKLVLKHYRPWATRRWKPYDPTFIGFDALPACDRQTDRHAAYSWVVGRCQIVQSGSSNPLFLSSGAKQSERFALACPSLDHNDLGQVTFHVGCVVFQARSQTSDKGWSFLFSSDFGPFQGLKIGVPMAV